jgi:hypothetical protein
VVGDTEVIVGMALPLFRIDYLHRGALDLLIARL